MISLGRIFQSLQARGKCDFLFLDFLRKSKPQNFVLVLPFTAPCTICHVWNAVARAGFGVPPTTQNTRLVRLGNHLHEVRAWDQAEAVSLAVVVASATTNDNVDMLGDEFTRMYAKLGSSFLGINLVWKPFF